MAGRLGRIGAGIVAGAAAMAVLGAVTAAEAGDRRWKQGYGYGHGPAYKQHYHHYRHRPEPRVVVVPRHHYHYVPPPVVYYAPPPRYYYYPATPSISFVFPLRF
ncbi:MAG: hypothetical protein KIT20_09910 [Alphaproteobacteria bacterium]|nr:hypothetical protein [Alphaproteobacteria bacterium]